MTQLHNVIYTICALSSSISRFDTTTHQRLADVDIKDMGWPNDIAACQRTSHVFVTDYEQCVWRVSADGRNVTRWLPRSLSDAFKPRTMSVTPSGLLVTSYNQLIQLNVDGDELRRVDLPDHVRPWHAVESPSGTFIVIHNNPDRQQVSEVDTGGEVLHQFTGSRLLPLREAQHIAIDSRGKVFVADAANCRILLLNFELALRRVIIDEHQLNYKEPSVLRGTVGTTARWVW